MEEKSNGPVKAKKILLIGAAVLLALMALALIDYLAANVILNSVGRIDPNENYGLKDPTSVFADGEPIEKTPISDQADALLAGSNIINILLVGQDQRPWETEGPQRTDAMVLCTLNMRDRSITMTSFLCDLWVYIPDLYNQRLNMPYKLGGFPLLNDTLEYNFGVRADHIVEINLAGFMDAVDNIGGIEIQLTAEEAEYLNRRGNWGVKTDPKWSLKEGPNLLNGSQALAYTRINQLGTDFARVDRHQTVLAALLREMGDMSSTDLFDLSREVLPLLSTDMSNNQIIELLLKILPLVSDLELNSQHIPLDGQYAYEKKGEADVLVMDREQLEANKRILNKTICGS